MEARPETGLSLAGQGSVEKLTHHPDGNLLFRAPEES